MMQLSTVFPSERTLCYSSTISATCRVKDIAFGVVVSFNSAADTLTTSTGFFVNSLWHTNSWEGVWITVGTSIDSAKQLSRTKQLNVMKLSWMK